MNTNRLFHMEHKLAILCAVSAILAGGAEPLYGEANSKQTKNSPALPSANPQETAVEQISPATENEETVRLINLGLQDTLLGYTSRARAYYKRALETEPNSALALCGMMLLEQNNRADYSEQLKKLTETINSPEFAATPEELFYVETFLKLISGDVKGAAEDFKNYSEKYRADVLSACWAAMLLHSADAKEARDYVGRLAAHHEEHPLVLYMRALVEEKSEQISDEAIKSVATAAAQLPHPMIHHLHGHLLFMSGKFSEAAKMFHVERNALSQDLKKYQLEQNDTFELHCAGLYEATALTQSKKFGDALRLRKSMSKLRSLSGEVEGRGDVLYRWEVMTLPMRTLLLRPEVPSADAIRAAYAAAVPHETLLDDEPVKDFVECLNCALQIRALCADKRFKTAAAVLQKAEKALERLHVPHETYSRRSITWKLCFKRALDCAETAVNIAKAEVYRSSAELWNEKVNSAIQIQPRMLPPMILKYSSKVKK